MSKLVSSVRKQLVKIILWQLAMIMGLALVMFLLQGIRGGFSTLMGGLAYWVPSVLFMWRVSAHSSARASVRFLVAFFSGEVFKLLFSAAIFIAATNYLSINLMYGFIGLSGAIVAFWIAAGVALTQQEVKS